MKEFVRKIVDTIQYDWNVKSALVYTLCWIIFIISLYIPLSAIIFLINCTTTDTISTNIVQDTLMILGVYVIFVATTIWWNVSSVINWVLNRIYQRTKWDGMTE